MSATAPRTSPSPVEQRTHRRVAGVAALVGILLITADNAILGNPPRDDAIDTLTYVAERPWAISRMVGLIGMLAWLVSFGALTRSWRTFAAGSLARLAQPVLTVAVAVLAVQYAFDGVGLTGAARSWQNSDVSAAEVGARGESFNLLIGGTSVLAQALLGLGLAGHALAVLLSREHSRIPSWCGVIAATGWFLAAAARFTRPADVAFELILPFAGLTSVWVIWLAVSVLRRSRIAGPPAAA